MIEIIILILVAVNLIIDLTVLITLRDKITEFPPSDRVIDKESV